MDAGRRPVTSLSTKGSPTPPAKLPFCRRCNGVPGCSQGGCNLKFKCRRTESPLARVVTFTGQNPTQTQLRDRGGGSHRRSWAEAMRSVTGRMCFAKGCGVTCSPGARAKERPWPAMTLPSGESAVRPTSAGKESLAKEVAILRRWLERLCRLFILLLK